MSEAALSIPRALPGEELLPRDAQENRTGHSAFHSAEG